MGADTSIEWADHTFNPWTGCTKIAAGCLHCYAEVGTTARIKRGQGVETWGDEAANDGSPA